MANMTLTSLFKFHYYLLNYIEHTTHTHCKICSERLMCIADVYVYSPIYIIDGKHLGRFASAMVTNIALQL